MTHIDPDYARRVEHMHGVTLEDLLLGRVPAQEVTSLSAADVSVNDETFQGPHGDITLRRYRPTVPTVGTLVWSHGGAWVGGDLDMPEADATGKRAAQSGVELVSVGYHLAPGHQHPVPVDEIVAVTQSEIASGDGPVAVGGASAGGHLSLLAALRLRDLGLPVAAVWLAYPGLDPYDGPFPDERPDGCPELLWFDRSLAPLGFGVYLGMDPASAPDEAVPARLDPSGLPPTLVTTAEVDALALQAVGWVAKARAAGVHVDHHEAEQLLHGYLNEVAVVPAALPHLDRHVSWLVGALQEARR